MVPAPGMDGSGRQTFTGEAGQQMRTRIRESEGSGSHNHARHGHGVFERNGPWNRPTRRNVMLYRRTHWSLRSADRYQLGLFRWPVIEAENLIRKVIEHTGPV